MALTVAALAVAAAGAVVLRRAEGIGRYGGSLLYLLGQVGLVAAMARAIATRASHFAALGVPTGWTRLELRGLRDPDLRR
ncbi:hypothetical protein ACFFWC_14230 [Plantactinospora siamensis]|uniref:Uncharacterized protein n=1 Tax=Plantactinospora siamensis TaxID=555372 RepID=A0ABV6P186_9ACTN